MKTSNQGSSNPHKNLGLEISVRLTHLCSFTVSSYSSMCSLLHKGALTLISNPYIVMLIGFAASKNEKLTCVIFSATEI